MRFGITSRLWLALLLMAVLPLIALQYVLEEYFSESMRRTIVDHLKVTNATKIAQIGSRMQHMLEGAKAVAQLEETRGILKEAVAAGKKGPAKQRLKQYLDIVEPALAGPDEFQNFLLVTLSGDVVLAHLQEADAGVNLYTGPYSQTILGQTVRKSQLSMREVFSGIEISPDSQALTAFFVIPVMDGKHQLGSFVIQLAQDSLHKLISDYSGLGETGEIVIAQRAGDDAVIVAPLRASREKLPLKVVKGSKSALFEALSGSKGVGVRKDYRDVEVLAAWSYLPSLQWGIVVKIDAEEAFHPIRQMHQWSEAILLSIIALVGLVALWLGRSIVRPIKSLTDVSTEIANGDLNRRIPHRFVNDELGDLTQSFNRMADNLQKSQAALLAERQGLAEAVQKRTADLENANAHLLQEIVEHDAAKEGLQLAQTVYQSMTQGVVVTDSKKRIISVNPSYCRITGYTSEDLMGRIAGFNKSGYHDEAFYRNMWETIAQSGHWEGEIWNTAKNGEVFPSWLTISVVRDRQGSVYRYIGVLSDITEQKKAQETIYLQANYDELTMLPNRRLFLDRLEQEVKKARRDKTQVALAFIDLDNFKEINDTFGHEWGDKLLKEAAQRIKTCVREVDTVARLGGDEFTVVLPYVKSNREADRVAQKIIDNLSVPFSLGGDQGYVSASIGITVFPFDGESSVVLLRNADQAMYEAKRLGKNRFSYYTSTMQEASQQRLQLSNELRIAMQNGELEMHYQPIHDLRDSRVVKAEALIRWRRPDGKYIGPDVFIGLAEEIGLIGEIGQYAFESSLHQMQTWEEIASYIVGVSVNLSPRQILGDRSNFQPWLALMKEKDISAEHVTLEITEGTLLDDSPVIRDKLAFLREAGCSFALDDFGTGYSSLSYLKKMNVDFIKVDKSFIRDLAVDQSDYALVEAIIVMAHKLGIKVVAEGVETAEQNGILKEIGCDFVQGYYYAKPMLPQDFINYLKAQIK